MYHFLGRAPAWRPASPYCNLPQGQVVGHPCKTYTQADLLSSALPSLAQSVGGDASACVQAERG